MSELPVITVFCPVTRSHFLDRWFDDLASTDLRPENTNLVFLIDCESPNTYARIMKEMNKTTFRKFIIIKNYEHRVNEANIPIRRQRIAEVHNQSKEAISALDGEYVLGLEDDTVFTGLQVQRLYSPFYTNDRIGLVSAYEAGRWYNKIIGIWEFDDVHEPTECWTCLPSKGYEKIDAAGFYCYLTPTELYLKHHYNTQPSEPWGPDVNYGLWLRREGLENWVDWEQPCGHRDNEGIITPDHSLVSESFFLQDSPNWVRRKQPLP